MALAMTLTRVTFCMRMACSDRPGGHSSKKPRSLVDKIEEADGGDAELL